MLEVADKINSILSKLKLYLEANFLHINIGKSKFIQFKTPRQISRNECDVDIKFGNTPLQQVKSIKFLGVIIDEKLNWAKHTQHVVCKVRSSIAQLYGMRKVIPKNLKGKALNGDSVDLWSLWNRRQSTKFNGVSYIVQRGAEAVYSVEGKQQVKDLIITLIYYL